jgi:hypothetical protein
MRGNLRILHLAADETADLAGAISAAFDDKAPANLAFTARHGKVPESAEPYRVGYAKILQCDVSMASS